MSIEKTIDEQALIYAINADPADWHARAVYHDWLEEHGRPEAAGWRILNMRKRVPHTIAPAEIWTFWSQKRGPFRDE